MGYAWKWKLGITVGAISVALAVMLPELTSLKMREPNETSKQAMANIRDWKMLKWYSIPLLALLFYIYTKEIYKARKNGNWDPVIAAITVFGVYLYNETLNGWVFVFTNYAPLWTAAGDTCFRFLIGTNYEIMFLVSFIGFTWYYGCSPKESDKIFGYIPNRYFFGGFLSFTALIIESALNVGGLLLWEYQFWNRTLWGSWVIWLFGYFHFFVVAVWVLEVKSNKNRIKALAFIYAISLFMNIYGFGVKGWNY